MNSGSAHQQTSYYRMIQNNNSNNTTQNTSQQQNQQGASVYQHHQQQAQAQGQGQQPPYLPPTSQFFNTPGLDDDLASPSSHANHHHNNNMNNMNNMNNINMQAPDFFARGVTNMGMGMGMGMGAGNPSTTGGGIGTGSSAAMNTSMGGNLSTNVGGVGGVGLASMNAMNMGSFLDPFKVGSTSSVTNSGSRAPMASGQLAQGQAQPMNQSQGGHQQQQGGQYTGLNKLFETNPADSEYEAATAFLSGQAMAHAQQQPPKKGAAKGNAASKPRKNQQQQQQFASMNFLEPTQHNAEMEVKPKKAGPGRKKKDASANQDASAPDSAAVRENMGPQGGIKKPKGKNAKSAAITAKGPGHTLASAVMTSALNNKFTAIAPPPQGLPMAMSPPSGIDMPKKRGRKPKAQVLAEQQAAAVAAAAASMPGSNVGAGVGMMWPAMLGQMPMPPPLQSIPQQSLGGKPEPKKRGPKKKTDSSDPSLMPNGMKQNALMNMPPMGAVPHPTAKQSADEQDKTKGKKKKAVPGVAEEGVSKPPGKKGKMSASAAAVAAQQANAVAALNAAMNADLGQGVGAGGKPKKLTKKQQAAVAAAAAAANPMMDSGLSADLLQQMNPMIGGAEFIGVPPTSVPIAPNNGGGGNRKQKVTKNGKALAAAAAAAAATSTLPIPSSGFLVAQSLLRGMGDRKGEGGTGASSSRDDSSGDLDHGNASGSGGGKFSVEERRKRRAESNRLSAERSRERRKNYMKGLEMGLKNLSTENSGLRKNLEMYHQHVKVLSGIVRGYNKSDHIAILDSFERNMRDMYSES